MVDYSNLDNWRRTGVLVQKMKIGANCIV